MNEGCPGRGARGQGTRETVEEKVARVVKEEVAVVPYDPSWPGD